MKYLGIICVLVGIMVRFSANLPVQSLEDLDRSLRGTIVIAVGVILHTRYWLK